jgi:hypothetical protein
MVRQAIGFLCPSFVIMWESATIFVVIILSTVNSSHYDKNKNVTMIILMAWPMVESRSHESTRTKKK